MRSCRFGGCCRTGELREAIGDVEDESFAGSRSRQRSDQIHGDVFQWSLR